MKHFTKSLLLSTVLLLLVTPNFAFSAELYLDPSKRTIIPGDTFVVNVRLDNEQECVNAADVKIKYSSDVLKVLDVSRGGSIFSLWVNTPSINEDTSTIHFSGGIPGGFCGRAQGDPGLTNILVKIVFSVKNSIKEGSTASVSILPDSEVLLNDGKGTKATLTVKKSDFTVSLKGTPRNEWLEELHQDDIPPEFFSVNINQNPNVFGGKYYIVFSTGDKQSGMDYFEIMETDASRDGFKSGSLREAIWKRGVSPYVLEDQTLNSKIKIRAVDKSGNERVVTYIPEKRLLGGGLGSILLIVLLVMVVVMVGVTIYGEKYSQKTQPKL